MCTRLREQLVIGLRAPGHHHEIARRDAAVDRERLDATAPAACLDVRRLLVAKVENADDVDAGGGQIGGRGEASVVGRDDVGPLRGTDRPEVDESPDGLREHHVDEVVAREDERLLDRPCRDDDLPGADPDERVAVRDRDQAGLEDADRDGGHEELHARNDRALPQLGRALVSLPVGEQRSTDVGPFVDEDHAVPSGRRRDGRLEAGLAPADHDDVRARVDDLDSLAPGAVRVEPPEAGGAPQDPLVERPEPPRADERLVVEARRRERPAELVDHPQQVPVERADIVLSGDDRARAHRGDAHADVRLAVHRHLAVGAVAGAAQKAARAVVLEAPREHATAGGVQGGADRVSPERPDGLPLTHERDLFRPVDQLGGMRGDARHDASSRASADPGVACQVRITSLVWV